MRGRKKGLRENDWSGIQAGKMKFIRVKREKKQYGIE